jgi:hypothetical protein
MKLDIRMTPELMARIDELRGHEPRGSFVKRTLESALSGGTPATAERTPVQASTAPTRAPENIAVARHAGNWAARKPLPPGVKSARELAMERQRKMNERKS